MKRLLDTHAFIWWDGDSTRLSATALAVLHDPTTEIFLSVVSVWEMVIKSQLGKLSLRLPLTDIVAHQRANGVRLLDMSLDHVLAVQKLPPTHKDPFDRLLAAQAIHEGLELVTADPIFNHYPVRVLW